MHTKQIGLIVGGILLLVILGAAAFVGSRLLAGSSPSAANSGGDRVIFQGMAGGPNGGIRKSIQLDIESAPELPTSPAAATGIFVRREDNRYFVGTGNIRMMISANQSGGAPQTDFSYDGPVVEVVVTRETQLYQDVTEPNFEAAQNGELKLQQVLAPADSLDDVDENTALQVWGERRGDRLIAAIVVYQQPQAMSR
jgi:hypothetical protein